ncbi:Nitroreductase [Mycena indigotica]|uniref:Nitroreductase n=1 Tax=Mycena indigotica TaxID=2126181 RepID=A0A8H6WAQ7_9AGAR|nr:Nitroreductase [Mycena indigotica]KAF7311834.1 Nitroreductase [Mycena indigotica]
MDSSSESNAAATVDRLLTQRFAARYYLPTPIPREVIEDIVNAANSVPSGFNLQPWNVYAMSGTAKDNLIAEMLAAHASHTPSTAQFDSASLNIPQSFEDRRRDFRNIFYEAQGVRRGDTEAKNAAEARNFTFFDAPVALIFTINRQLNAAAWLDLGAFVQGITMGVRARGLECVPMLSIPRYDAIIRKHFDIPADDIVAIGMAVGFADHEKIQKYYVRPAKRPLDDVLHLSGFP